MKVDPFKQLPLPGMWVSDAVRPQGSNDLCYYVWYGAYRVYIKDLSVEHFVGAKTEKLGKIAETLEETKQFIENQTLLEG